MKPFIYLITILTLILLQSSCVNQSSKLYTLTEEDGRYLISREDGQKLRITAYGEHIIRLQSARADEVFLPDLHYQMVETHDWKREAAVMERANSIEISTSSIRAVVDTTSLAVQFFSHNSNEPILEELHGATWNTDTVAVEFKADENERFTGLGHGYYGRSDTIELTGQTIGRNYGTKKDQQAPLLVPFYMSNKGYGVFLNSTFSNQFTFADDEKYSIAINDFGFDGKMDYFFIAGPKLKQVLNNYTQLTGRPRLPPKSMFGLQLSDKAQEHDGVSSEKWWQAKILEHRAADLAIDHVINDNRWRAEGGRRCVSKLDWDNTRYPNPAKYKQWLDQNGLVATLDFNRCIAQFSEGWKPTFNLTNPGNIDFKESAPDLTNPEFQRWFWQVFHDKALAPHKGYPGDAMWIDEFDEQGEAPQDTILSNGRSLAEMRNYWFFLIGQSLVENGWDKADMGKRPFVWVRGMSAGAQRFATLWSGDIKPTNDDMQKQIISMQLAGLSGFPYWGHDAGGFYDFEAKVGPNADMYQRWSMAYGSFAPIWKPHGMGPSRWPADRSDAELRTAKKFSKLRYEMMPYLYSTAHYASEFGVPIARPMLLNYQSEPQAWEEELQYMWGDSILVAPLIDETGMRTIWLPKGRWYAYNSSVPIAGDTHLTNNYSNNVLPLFVKAGGIIPKRKYALSTAFIKKDFLRIDIYTGDDGAFTLYEDDDKTEHYRSKGERAVTALSYTEKSRTFKFGATEGSYKGAPKTRDLQLRFYGAGPTSNVTINNQPHKFKTIGNDVIIDTVNVPVTEQLVIALK